jgi:antitoxin YefM
MKVVSYTHARSHLAETMDIVCDGSAPIVITRQNARPVVMLSLADYEALEETVYLLRSPKNATRLAQSIDEIESGKAKERKLLR